jgi:hypothetical protein
MYRRNVLTEIEKLSEKIWIVVEVHAPMVSAFAASAGLSAGIAARAGAFYWH